MAYRRELTECPPFTWDEERRYAEILKGESYTKCFISPIYYYIIHFGARRPSITSAVEVIDTDAEVFIRGELVIEAGDEEKVAEEFRKIITRGSGDELERPCTVTMIHKHEVDSKEVSHVHFICSTESFIYMSENVEKILKGIKRIADKYGIKEW